MAGPAGPPTTVLPGEGGTSGGGHLPAQCKVQGISGVSQIHSVSGSGDAGFFAVSTAATCYYD